MVELPVLAVLSQDSKDKTVRDQVSGPAWGREDS